MLLWAIASFNDKIKYKMPLFVASDVLMLIAILFVDGIKTPILCVLFNIFIPILIGLYLIFFKKVSVKEFLTKKTITYFFLTFSLLLVVVFVYIIFPNAISIVDLKH